ncbi:MAG: competence protein ComEC family protein, partial [Paramuribaculum sp.]|nr:competence protein ComEC family protein [Paramuribaculum sp.]
LKAPLSLVPLFPVTIAFAGGIFLASVGLPLWSSGIWIILSIILALRQMRYYAAVVAAVALGQINLWIQSPSETAVKSLEGDIFLTADIEAVRETETSQILRVKIIRTGRDSSQLHKTAGIRSQIVIPTFNPAVSPGERIYLKAKMSIPDAVEYFPDHLTYYKILKRQGILISGIATPEDIYLIEDSPALLAIFPRLKTKVKNALLSSNLNGETKEFLVTAITGDSNILDNDTRKTFAKAGTAHILALSGLHVGIIMAFCSLLLLPLILYPSLRKVRTLLIILALWIFAFITGLSASATRAVIMATCLLLATLLQKRHSPFNALCLAALVILLFDPDALFNISFQLSFAAVAGILLFGNKLNPVSQRNREAYITMGFFTMSAGAMIATGVISGFYFHTFPVYFILANFLIIPFLAPLIGGGVLIIMLSFTGLSSKYVCAAADTLYSWVKGVCDTISNLPGASINHLTINSVSLIVWIAAITLFALWLYKHRKVFGYGSMICAATFIILIAIPEAKTHHGVYIIPQTYRTDIAVCSPKKIDIITTAMHREKEKVKDSNTRIFSEYMLNRNIDSLEVAGKKFGNDYVIYNYPILTVGSKRILIADTELTVPQGAAFDYILVCRGFKNTIAELNEMYDSKLIILSGDLHPKRLSNYIAECNNYGINYTTLKNNPLNNLLTIP